MYRFKIDLMLFDSVRFSLFHLYIFLLCFCSVYSPRAKHNGKQLSPFAPRLGRRLGVAVDSISGRAKLSVSKHAAVEGDVMPCAPSKGMRSTGSVLLGSI